jgi:folate-binding protein YgfZ
LAKEIPVSVCEQDSYESARTGAVYRKEESRGAVLIEGLDRLGFIQRQTTNDMRVVQPARVVRNVATDPNGRIIDAFTVVEAGTHYTLLTEAGRASALTAYLRSKVFFMDKIVVEDISHETVQFTIDGLRAPDVLSGLGVSYPPEIDGIAEGMVNNVPIKVIGQPGLTGIGFRVIAPPDMETAVAAIENAGARLLPESCYEIMRIEAGLPAAGAELTSGYTPFEAGLGNLVADGKGCYTGQEVLARQVSYAKITRRLVGLRCAEPVTAGSVVRVDGRRVGLVTSAGISPRLGPVALAMIRRPHHEAGTPVTAGDTTGEVVSLPMA